MEVQTAIGDAECLIDRPGIGRALLVEFGGIVAITEGDEHSPTGEKASSRILVIDVSGREIWTNSIDIAEEILGTQMSLF